MGCGSTFLKVILITVNTIFFLAGAAVLGVGLWIRFDTTIEDFKGSAGGLEEFRTSLHTAAYILIAFGAFTFFVGFCGCFGAIKENKCLLGVYIFFIVIVLGAEIAGGVYAYASKDGLINDFTDIAQKYIHSSYNDSGSDDDNGWNFVMVLFECCGVNNYTDFKNSTYSRSRDASTSRDASISVPPACCKQRKADSGETGPEDYPVCKREANGEKSDKQLMKDGCKGKVIDFITENSTILLAVAAGIAGFELIVVLVAIIFCCSVDSDD